MKKGYKGKMAKLLGGKKKKSSGKKMSPLSSAKPASSPMGFSKVKSYDKSKNMMKPINKGM